MTFVLGHRLTTNRTICFRPELAPTATAARRGRLFLINLVPFIVLNQIVTCQGQGGSGIFCVDDDEAFVAAKFLSTFSFVLSSSSCRHQLIHRFTR